MIDSFRVDDGAAKATRLLRGDKLVRRGKRGEEVVQENAGCEMRRGRNGTTGLDADDA